MIGELAAISAAFLWAVASVIYATLGYQVPALALNLGKGLIAIALLGITILAQGLIAHSLTTPNSLLLLLSGAIGIGFGDTVYLEALRFLGVRRTLLLGTLAPPMAACLALFFLGERPSRLAWLGMGVTLVGVIWVICERVSGDGRRRSPGSACRPVGDHRPSSSQAAQGLLYALLAALAQAIGALLSRAALENTPISPLWAALLRLLAGVVIVGGWGCLRQQIQGWWQAVKANHLLIRLLAAAFMGTYLGIWFQQVSLKYTATGISQTLSATSPLFVLPIAVLLGERVSHRAWLGATLAVLGVGLLLAQNQ
ncbi:MAG: DMT family transporter [Acaryochloridaceae cyanobacterium CSU_3_4]|nr:DMT family transporter [Acaryochloridaceae cyanobacterium CSU_3_4]